MKDFKQTPKMNAQGSHYCGGGKVKKMAVGGTTGDDIMEAIRSGKAKPVEMPSGPRNSEGVDIPGMGRAKPVEMPSGRGDLDGGFDVPGIGRIKPAPMPKTERGAMLLKKGGKVKRGKISK